jgi:Zn finger protein HypA/HybF involved in hydrogenase expression
MFKKINSLFNRLSRKEPVPVETKKCKKCLMRIDLKYVTCPYCKSGDFHFDDS